MYINMVVNLHIVYAKNSYVTYKGYLLDSNTMDKIENLHRLSRFLRKNICSVPICICSV